MNEEDKARVLAVLTEEPRRMFYIMRDSGQLDKAEVYTKKILMELKSEGKAKVKSGLWSRKEVANA